MIMSRITLSQEIRPRDITRLVPSSGYKDHALLWKFFSDDPHRKRDFLFRKDITQGRPMYYVVSEREPMRNADEWIIESKPYSPLLREGERYSFSLRVNPVRSRRNSDGKQERHDVIMEARKKLVEGGVPRNEFPPLAEIVQSECSAWLNSRALRLGFEPLFIRADGYQQHRYYKRDAKKEIAISTVELSGFLEILEAQTFNETLFNGIGHSKGFGCGLLLIRRM